MAMPVMPTSPTIVLGIYLLALLYIDLAEMAVEQEDVKAAAADRQLLVETDDDGVAVKIVVGPKQDWIVHAGMHYFAADAGAHGRTIGIGDVEAVMRAIATTAGRAELIAGSADLVEAIRGQEGRTNPQVVALFRRQRLEIGPLAHWAFDQFGQRRRRRRRGKGRLGDRRRNGFEAGNGNDLYLGQRLVDNLFHHRRHDD